MAMSKRSREMRVALEAAMRATQAQLSTGVPTVDIPTARERRPDNDPDAFRTSPAIEPAPLSLFERELEELKRRESFVEGGPVREIKTRDHNWDSITNGVLLREDVTASQNKRLRREFKDWVTKGNRKLFKSLNILGVDNIDIDWKAARAAYASMAA